MTPRNATVCRGENILNLIFLKPTNIPFWLKLLASVLIVEFLGGLGAAVTSSQIPDWYAGLQKPPGTPPNWLFGPVWVTLYGMIGAAFAIVWHFARPGTAKRIALSWFAVQLILNLAWTPVFFGLHQMFAALIVIVALWAAIATTIIHFGRLQSVGAVLLVPYLVWVSYATYLNAGYWYLNR